MVRVNQRRQQMMRDPNVDDFIETSREMVNFFAGDPDYKLNYVVVSGVKVFVEGTQEATEDKESKSVHHY